MASRASTFVRAPATAVKPSPSPLLLVKKQTRRFRLRQSLMLSISLHHRARSRARNTTDRSHARPTITLRSIPRRRRVSSPRWAASLPPPRRKPIHRPLHARVVTTPRRPSRAFDHRRHPPPAPLVRVVARVSHLARVSTVKVIHDRIQRPDVPLKDGVHARVARGHDAGRDVHESPSRPARRASSVETRARQAGVVASSRWIPSFGTDQRLFCASEVPYCICV